MRNTIFLLALLCAACSSTTASLPTIRPYHMDIQQGNVVTNKMMLQLKPGMTKSQVRFVMGTPLISDSFHSDRWDYFYSMKKDGRLIEQRRVILDFENDKLKHVRGDVIPAGSAGDTAAEADKKAAAQPKSIWENRPTEPRKEKGWMDKLKFWGDDKPEMKPEVKPEAKPEETPPPRPKRMEVEKVQPAPAEAPKQEEKKGLLDKLKFWGDDTKAAPEAEAPAVKPAPKPVARPKPEVKVEEAKPQEAKAKPAPVAETVAKPVPKPADLPPEDDPGYFEHMLEKIGF